MLAGAMGEVWGVNRTRSHSQGGHGWGFGCVDCGVKGVQVGSLRCGHVQFRGCGRLSTVGTVSCNSFQRVPTCARRVRGVHYVDTAKAGSLFELKFLTSP
eukprot:6149048-Prymnesium_polylepis.1